MQSYRDTKKALGASKTAAGVKSRMIAEFDTELRPTNAKYQQKGVVG
jgi:hypothetical protein